jgi:hypothetical protein
MPRKKGQKGQVKRAAERVAEAGKQTVTRVRRKLSTSKTGERMSFGEFGAVVGGGIAGSLAYQAVAHGLKVNPYIAAGGVTVAGAGLAFLLDGKPQAASAGMATAGVIHGISHAAKLRNADGADESEVEAEIDRMQSRPRDLREAFEMARRSAPRPAREVPRRVG